jgi:hypothetical protein
MINTTSLYFVLTVNGQVLPILEKGLSAFEYTYGIFSTIPMWRMEFFDQFGIAFAIKGAYSIGLSFGDSLQNCIKQACTIKSELNIEGSSFGLPSAAGAFTLYGIPTLLNYLYMERLGQAYLIPQGSNLLPIFTAHDVIDCDFKMNPTLQPLCVYKGTETHVQFLRKLTFFCSNSAQVPGCALYYDTACKGHLTLFLQKIGNTLSQANAKNTIITQTKAYALTSTSVQNTIRTSVYDEGLFHLFRYLDTTDLSNVYWAPNSTADYSDRILLKNIKFMATQEQLSQMVETRLPLIIKEVVDLTKSSPLMLVYEFMNQLNGLEKEFGFYFALNREFWRYASQIITEVVVNGFLNDADCEPGNLVALYDNPVAPNGVYVILQKSYIIAERSGLYTKFYLVHLKGT